MINFSTILHPGERIIAKGRLHVGAFIVPLVVMLIGAAVMFLELGETLARFRLVGALFLIAGAWTTLKALSARLSTQLVLTDERLLGESGLFKHRKIALPIRQVEKVEVSYSLLGRMLGYGTLEVCGRNRLRERYSQITGAKQLLLQAQKLMYGSPKGVPRIA